MAKKEKVQKKKSFQILFVFLVILTVFAAAIVACWVGGCCGSKTPVCSAEQQALSSQPEVTAEATVQPDA